MNKEKTLWTKDDRHTMNTMDYEAFHNYTEHALKVDYHTHDFYEILIFLSGYVDYYVEDKIYKLRPGDILLTNNQEHHRPIIHGGKLYERYVVWIHPTFIQKLMGYDSDIDLAQCFDNSSKMHYNLLKPDADLFQEIITLVEKLLTPKDGSRFANDQLYNCYLTELLIYLNQAYQDTTITPGVNVIANTKINDIVNYINQNLCEDLSLEFLAQEFYISKFYLSRLFKQYTSLTLHQYILKKRLAFARTQLKNGASPYAACAEGGFNNYSHFSKSFKEAYGISPRQFIEELSQEKETAQS